MPGVEFETNMLFEQCPKCREHMVSGFICTEQKANILRGLRCSDIKFSREFKMGFSGSPKGEKVSTHNVHNKYVAIPAVRCPKCRYIAFEY